jgi:glycerol kinase
MEKYILTIDSGTTSCRSLLVDQKGNVVHISQKEFTQIFPKSGWVEHDPLEIWRTQLWTIEQLLTESAIQMDQVLAIGITNQRETTVVWDKITGKPVYNAIVWQDRRTAPICEQLKNAGHEATIFQNTGLVVDAYFSGTKVKWILDFLKEHSPSTEIKNLMFGTVDSWLLWNLTGGKSHCTDFTNASRTMMYNIKTLDWDEHLLNLLEVPKSMLPEVKNSSDYYGEFEYKGYSIPICGIAGDQQSALFGQACFEPGMAKNTYGTGCFLLMNVGSEFVSSNNGLLTTLCCDKFGKPCYALEGSVFVAGAAIQWLRDGLKIIKHSTDSEQMAEEVKDSDDLVVVPAFAGLGAPYWDMYARGAIFGLSRGTNQNHIVKATLDSIAFQTKDILMAMEKDYGSPMHILKVDGGASSNDYLMQFQSDILDVAVERPENVETTAMGAAYLAGLYQGLWTHESILRNRLINQEFTPKMDEAKRSRLYDQWQKAVHRCMNWVEKEA